MSEVNESESVGSLRTKLTGDMLGCDCLLSLFWTAMNSYRHDNLLRPYPPMFTTAAENKQISDVRTVFNSLPSMDKVLNKMATLSSRQADLMEWIVTPRTFSLQYRPPSTIDHILSQSKLPATAQSSSLKPQYVFELVYKEELEATFQTVVGSHGVFYAYHGSSLENFHSILHNGLLNMFNKVSAFGEGTYLSSELSVCLNWSPSGALWSGSSLPHTASCVVVCEVVKHPSVLSKDVQQGSEPNLQSQVPEEYFIVSNDELLRVKYLLLYRRESARSTGRSWMCKNIFVVVLLLYGIILLLVGAVQSNTLKKLYRKYINRS